MILFLADENFDAGIVGGLIRLEPTTEVVTVQEVGLGGTDDDTVLAWAAADARGADARRPDDAGIRLRAGAS
jgi:hypothetical protein